MASNFHNPCYLVLFLDLFLNSICIWRHAVVWNAWCLTSNSEAIVIEESHFRKLWAVILLLEILLLEIDIFKVPSGPLQQSTRKCFGNLYLTRNWQSNIRNLFEAIFYVGLRIFQWWLIMFCLVSFFFLILHTHLILVFVTMQAKCLVVSVNF